jgi:hypothetical protein
MISTFTGWALTCGIVAIGATFHQGLRQGSPLRPLLRR